MWKKAFMPTCFSEMLPWAHNLLIHIHKITYEHIHSYPPSITGSGYPRLANTLIKPDH